MNKNYVIQKCLLMLHKTVKDEHSGNENRFQYRKKNNLTYKWPIVKKLNIDGTLVLLL